MGEGLARIISVTQEFIYRSTYEGHPGADMSFLDSRSQWLQYSPPGFGCWRTEVSRNKRIHLIFFFIRDAMTFKSLEEGGTRSAMEEEPSMRGTYY